MEIKKSAVVYLHTNINTNINILILIESANQHYNVLDKYWTSIYKDKSRKCYILKKDVKFFEHIINKGAIQTDQSKLEEIKSFKRPKCIKTLRSFLGIWIYYRRFIKGYANKSKTLQDLCIRNTQNKAYWLIDD